MTAPRQQHAATSAIALERGDPTILDAAARSEVHLAIWQRPLPLALAWLPQLDWTKIDDLDFATTLAMVEADVAEGLAEAGYPAGARGDALAEEVIGHARRFAAIQNIDALGIRLEVIDTDACCKFHADYVTARLLATLVGSGTQWIHGAAGHDVPIRQMRTGDVAIFKGRLATEVPAILHRSPPIGDTGETRLLLAIDPAPTLSPRA